MWTGPDDRRVVATRLEPTRSDEAPPLIAHVIFRLDVGGLENGLINLINRIPPERFRHVIICLTDYSEVRSRLERDIPVFALHKRPGNSPTMHWKLWRLLNRLKPDIVHTRNLAALECTVPAFWARVPVRIHGEHGRDVEDLDGTSLSRRRLRRIFKPFVHQYVALSKDLETYLRDCIHVPAAKIAQFWNGVDTEIFRPAQGGREPLPVAGFAPSDAFVIGTVGRMQEVKDQVTLARAFVRLARAAPGMERRLRLVMVGNGPLRAQAAAILQEAGLGELAWLPGERDDVARLMRGLDVFVLPSLAEGISNTILEAMASGLPVIATAVGGNPELVHDGHNGTLVPRSDPDALAAAMLQYYSDPAERQRHGRQGRNTAVQRFSIATMVSSYVDLYDRMLEGKKGNVRYHGHLR